MPAYDSRHREAESHDLRESRLDDTYARLERFQNDFKIRVLLDDAPRSSDLSYERVNANCAPSLRSFCDMFDGEMRKYPTQLLDASKLESVSLVTALHWNGHPVMALASIRFRTIFFDISHFEATQDPTTNERRRLVLHHEVFHHLDVALNGPECFIRDEAWPNSRNQTGHLSGAGLDFDTSGKIAGFVFGHGAPNVGEDKADVFAFLMVESAYQKIAPRLNTDRVLKAKFEHIKSLVQSVAPQIGSECGPLHARK